MTGVMMEPNDKSFELRQILCDMNVLTRSDGSAFLVQGQTAVMASVNGPIEVRLQNLQIDSANVEVYYRRRSGQTAVGERMWEQVVRSTCKTAILAAIYPRTAISIQLQEMEDRAGLLACAINAACLALLNSGLAMRFLVGAVHCILNKNDELILDPDHRQATAEVTKASFTFAFDSGHQKTVAIHSNGQFTLGQFNDAQELCRAASTELFKRFREIIGEFKK